MSGVGLGKSVAIGGAALVAAVALIGPERLHLLPGCLFHEWTGLLCAGCGSTRAVAALTRGDLVAALGYNPLTVAFLVTLPGLLLLRRAGFRPAPALVWLGVAMLGLFWILRNLPLAVFDALRP